MLKLTNKTLNEVYMEGWNNWLVVNTYPLYTIEYLEFSQGQKDREHEEEKTAFEKGFRAFCDGLMYTVNPYPTETFAHSNFMCGWRFALNG